MSSPGAPSAESLVRALPVGFRVIHDGDRITFARRGIAPGPQFRLPVTLFGALASGSVLAGFLNTGDVLSSLAAFLLFAFMGRFAFRAVRDVVNTTSLHVNALRIEIEQRPLPARPVKPIPATQIDAIQTRYDDVEEAWRVVARLADGTDEVLVRHIAEGAAAEALRLEIERALGRRDEG